MKHTGGPWRVVKLTKDSFYVEGGTFNFTPYGHQLCGIKANDCASGLLPREEHEANAHLIASAPDMLEALKALKEALYHKDAMPQEVLDDMLIAIAKAEGREI